VNADGLWSDSTKWLSGAIADGAGATGNFTFNITGTHIITIDGAVASRTLGIMNIGDSAGSPSNYGIAATGGGTLTFDNSGLNAQLNETSTSGNNTISAPIILNSSLDITNASANNLTLSGGISATAGTKTITTSTGTVIVGTTAITDGAGVIAVTQNGPGTLALGTLSNTYSGGTTIAGGKITIGGTGTPIGSGTLTLAGGTLVTTANRMPGAALANDISVTADSAITTTSNAAAPLLPFTGTLTGTGGTLTLRNDAASTTGQFDVRFSGGDYTMTQPIVIDNGAGGGTTRLSDFNASGTTHTYNGVISGNGSYNRSVSSGAGGNTIFTANNTYTGTTTVDTGTLGITNSNSAASGRISGTSNITVNSGGTLMLAGSGAWTDRINDSATMTLNGGKFNTGGLSEHGATNNTAGIGALTLQSTSTINMGSGNSIIAFANSSAQTWTGTLSIFNWSGAPAGGGTDQLYFGNDNTGLTTSQLGEINIYSDNGTTLLGAAMILADGEIVPVPEPATWFIGALLVTATVGMSLHRIRRRRAAIVTS
jgi:autotransporter-associated beta strand protein